MGLEKAVKIYLYEAKISDFKKWNGNKVINNYNINKDVCHILVNLIDKLMILTYHEYMLE